MALIGKVARGLDYKLYLTPSCVETDTEFEAIRDRAVHVGEVKTIENLIAPVPDGIAPADYNTLVAWCEALRRVHHRCILSRDSVTRVRVLKQINDFSDGACSRAIPAQAIPASLDEETICVAKVTGSVGPCSNPG